MTANDQDELTQHELEILEEIAGLREAAPWGAWVGVALGYLARKGFITHKFGGRLTDKGRAVLKAAHPEWGARNEP